MSENVGAAPVQIRVSVVGPQWVQVASISGAAKSKLVEVNDVGFYLQVPLIISAPCVQVGEPALTTEGR